MNSTSWAITSATRRCSADRFGIKLSARRGSRELSRMAVDLGQCPPGRDRFLRKYASRETVRSWWEFRCGANAVSAHAFVETLSSATTALPSSRNETRASRNRSGSCNCGTCAQPGRIVRACLGQPGRQFTRHRRGRGLVLLADEHQHRHLDRLEIRPEIEPRQSLAGGAEHARVGAEESGQALSHQRRVRRLEIGREETAHRGLAQGAEPLLARDGGHGPEGLTPGLGEASAAIGQDQTRARPGCRIAI